MKVALCFNGLVGGKIGKNGKGENFDPKTAYKYYKKHILDVNDDVDIFIHSWSVDEKDRLLELYKPKKWIIEKQKDFPQSAIRPKEIKSRKKIIKYYFFRLFDKSKFNLITNELNNSAFRVYSRWYSSKKSLELKRKFEEENNFKYDVVMLTRLDVAFFTDIIFSNYNMNFIYFSNVINVPKVGESLDDVKKRKETFGDLIYDFWFFSNSDYMDKFSLLYDHIEDYTISPHRSPKHHVEKFIGKEKIKYVLYRWFDFEMIRTKFYGWGDGREQYKYEQQKLSNNTLISNNKDSK
jgi:hypothetical protein